MLKIVGVKIVKRLRQAKVGSVGIGGGGVDNGVGGTGHIGRIVERTGGHHLKAAPVGGNDQEVAGNFVRVVFDNVGLKN